MDDIFTPVEEDQELPENALEELVGEGKKFADHNALAKGKIEADRYIERLTSELAEMRQELTKQLTMEEIMTQIRQSAPAGQPSTPQEPQAPKDDAPDIEKLVAQMIDQKKSEERTLGNVALVDEKLRNAFGADAAKKVSAKARELDMSLQELKDYAVRSPKAFLKLMDIDKEATPAPATQAPRGTAQTPPASGGRDRAYYERLKAQDRAKYFSTEVQKEFYKDMTAVLKAGGTW